MLTVLAALGYAALTFAIVFLLLYGMGYDWIQRGKVLLALALLPILSGCVIGCVAYESGRIDLTNPSPVLTPTQVKQAEKACTFYKRGIACWRSEGRP